MQGSELTKEGRLVYDFAKNLIRQLQDVKNGILEVSQDPRGSVRIEASTIPGEHILPRLINEFKKSHQGIDFIIQISDTTEAFSKVSEGRVDLAAVGSLSLAPRDSELDRIVIGQERLVFIVPKRHKLAKKRSVRVSEIPLENFISREKGSGTRAEIEKLLLDAGVNLKNIRSKMEVGSTQAVLSAVADGAGVSIVSETAARKAESAHQIKILEIQGTADKREFYLVRRAKPELPKPPRLFWEYCKNSIRV